MPERGLRVETLRAARPLQVGAVTLLPIERTIVWAGLGAAGAWASGASEPVALVVRDAEGLRVIAVGAAELSLEELRERVPGLEALVAAAPG